MRRYLCLLAAALVVWLFGWLAAKALIVSSDLPAADAVVVLAGSSTYLERTQVAAKLFFEGRSPNIILTNDGQRGSWSRERELNPLFVERAVADLQRRGVPSDRIKVIPGTAHSTHEEAMQLRHYAIDNQLRSILLVATPYQTRRARWDFNRVFRGTSVVIGIVAAPPGEQSPGPATWWLYPLGWKLVPGEYVKLVYYVLRY